MNWFAKLIVFLDELVISLFHDPHAQPPHELPMNSPIIPPKPLISLETKETPTEALCITAKRYIGKDASPLNRAPKEVSCAEGIVHIVNETWPGTLDHNIVGTDTLFQALRHSPRFKGVLDPVPGCIEISPRTPDKNGHVGIYVAADSIASNDSRDGIFRENYTRQSWRNSFIKKRGLKAYIFMPV